ncbi:hypothetical protein F5Y08DRAFT_342345 [Xylaria arbuscula]|nr:hypothetical protein F5Y08DRAFT_342345 [Xylaria arbuscula]
MDVILQFIEDGELSELDRANLNMLRATLQYPADVTIKCIKLAQDINFIVNANNQKDRKDRPVDVLFYLWSLIIEISSCIPPDHPWQDSLLQAIDYLHRQDGTVPGLGANRWKELPYLSLRIRELWIDPTVEVEGDLEESKLTRWKNQNSFVARPIGAFFNPGPTFPIWQLRLALEEPPINGPGLECRLWVACEWIIRCSRIIYKCMDAGLSNHTAFQTGSLCHEVPHFSIERWNFWKKRLTEIPADSTNLNLDLAIVTRISHTIEIMEGFGK